MGGRVTSPFDHFSKSLVYPLSSPSHYWPQWFIASMKSYLVIIGPNSYAQLAKCEIRQVLSQFIHCSISLI